MTVEDDLIREAAKLLRRIYTLPRSQRDNLYRAIKADIDLLLEKAR